ncbi:hypothetical protein SAMD00019534_083370 [Acytostelium subglobosum LB1]|uniref:hypothetical protein n=1 Tax=Acytostelium subglobosum LB1 TaxID=1410327 RepID=UPI000644D74D|nr:hypothetical protein SAMD00019534_083370 [Acytostelium subglobosum LB1]GAM25162.1 hypothetical protein SAMD00019534_083370 [Acytostelium subglobosum LB1]|eukprot:XP_012751682.1 hypothetical protein SAMD00019534_083370 [Acytostelium subglobosum LB1]
MSDVNISKLKVAELKEELTKRGLSTSGMLKPALVEALKKQMDLEAQQASSSSSAQQQQQSEEVAVPKEDSPKPNEDVTTKIDAETETEMKDDRQQQVETTSSIKEDTMSDDAVVATDNQQHNNNNNNDDDDESKLQDEKKNKLKEKLEKETREREDKLKEQLGKDRDDRKRKELESSGSGTNIIINSSDIDNKRQRVDGPSSSSSNNVDEKVDVSSAKKPVSRTLLIVNFIRPFRVEHAKQLMSETGTVEQFWMNDVRSYCFVTFATEEEAIATRNRLHGLVWPELNRTKLSVEYSSEKEFEIAQKHSRSSVPVISEAPEPVAAGNGGKQKQQKKKQQQNESDTSSNKSTTSSASTTSTTTTTTTTPPPPALSKADMDKLYRKTVTKPEIYYLPLTDEEVEARKIRQRNGSKLPFVVGPSTDIRKDPGVVEK